MITLTASVPFGIKSVDVVIEAERSSAFSVEGLPEASARKVKVRVLSACNVLGLSPRARIVVHEIPPFPTSTLDLTVAIAALAAEGAVGLPATPPTLHGELDLAGTLRPVRGLYAALRRGTPAIVPERQWREASVSRSQCFAASCLADVVRWFKELPGVPPAITRREPEILRLENPDSANIKQWFTDAVAIVAPREPEILSSGIPWHKIEGDVPTTLRGMHKRLLLICPQRGRTILARQLASDLEPPTDVENVLAIYSVAGILPDGPMHVPFRAPHHTVSEAGLLGGGNYWRPDEVSLAHGGCLFLDEVDEFRRSTLEALANVLRDGHVDIVRGGLRATFPAKPQLVVGACRPEDAGLARKLFPWTSEVTL